jgi:integrase/recombinase XerD
MLYFARMTTTAPAPMQCKEVALEIVLDSPTRTSKGTAGDLVTRNNANQRAIGQLWAEDLDAQVVAGLKSSRTADAYKKYALEWLSWLSRNEVATPTPAHCMAWLGVIRQRLAPASVNANLAAVKSLYAWAETRNAYPNIARSVRGLTVRKDEPLDALDPAQVAHLARLAGKAGLAGYRDCALVHVAYATACRRVSICEADLGDLDLQDAVLRYRGKGDPDKVRRAYLSPSALEAVRRYLRLRQLEEGTLPPSAPLFAAVGNRARGGRLDLRSLTRIVSRLMQRGGHIARDEAGHITRPRVLGFHSLRRSAVTAAFEAQGLEAAQSLAGHADPRTTTRAYARVNKGKVLRQLASVLDLGGESL